jgi:hypothetical protein
MDLHPPFLSPIRFIITKCRGFARESRAAPFFLQAWPDCPSFRQNLPNHWKYFLQLNHYPDILIKNAKMHKNKQ